MGTGTVVKIGIQNNPCNYKENRSFKDRPCRPVQSGMSDRYLFQVEIILDIH